MKNLTLTLIITISFFFAANCLANTGDDNTEKVKTRSLPVEKTQSTKAGSEKEKKNDVKPVQVKYIWKDMPTFDKYGNEITARMRENMKNNEMLNKENNNNK